MKKKSKDKRHEARKRTAMRRGQVVVIRGGRGLNPLGMVDPNAGLIRVTPDGIFEYAR